MRIIKENKGVTLIALVITIIVLLILAGVAITSLSGDNSAPQKAREAKMLSDNADEEDAIKMAVIESMARGNDAQVSDENLRATLEGVAKSITSNADGTWTVVGLNGGLFKVSKNGFVEKISGIILDSENLKLVQDGTVTLNARVSVDLSGKTITWYSTKENIATVDDNGLVKIKSNATIGETVELYAKAGNVESKNRCLIKVVQKISNVTNLTATGKVGKEISISLPANTEDIKSYELLEDASTYLEIKSSKLYGKDVTPVTPTEVTAQVKLIGNSGAYTTVDITVEEDLPNYGKIAVFDYTDSGTGELVEVDVAETANNTTLSSGWKYFYKDDQEKKIYLIYAYFLENEAIPTADGITKSSGKVSCNSRNNLKNYLNGVNTTFTGKWASTIKDENNEDIVNTNEGWNGIANGIQTSINTKLSHINSGISVSGVKAMGGSSMKLFESSFNAMNRSIRFEASDDRTVTGGIREGYLFRKGGTTEWNWSVNLGLLSKQIGGDNRSIYGLPTTSTIDMFWLTDFACNTKTFSNSLCAIFQNNVTSYEVTNGYSAIRPVVSIPYSTEEEANIILTALELND